MWECRERGRSTNGENGRRSDSDFAGRARGSGCAPILPAPLAGRAMVRAGAQVVEHQDRGAGCTSAQRDAWGTGDPRMTAARRRWQALLVASALAGLALSFCTYTAVQSAGGGIAAAQAASSRMSAAVAAASRSNAAIGRTSQRADQLLHHAECPRPYGPSMIAANRETRLLSRDLAIALAKLSNATGISPSVVAGPWAAMRPRLLVNAAVLAGTSLASMLLVVRSHPRRASVGVVLLGAGLLAAAVPLSTPTALSSFCRTALSTPGAVQQQLFQCNLDYSLPTLHMAASIRGLMAQSSELSAIGAFCLNDPDLTLSNELSFNSLHVLQHANESFALQCPNLHAQNATAVGALCRNGGAANSLNAAITLHTLSHLCWCVLAAVALYLARPSKVADVPTTEAHELLHILGGAGTTVFDDGNVVV